ncbi:MAG: CatB-related O-acetyltransferase [Patescibacteria group bacterium]|jgi:lipopolysaccharide transport system ATP-binding protein
MKKFLSNLYYKYLNRTESHNIGCDYTKRVLKNRFFEIGEYTYGIPKVIGFGSEKNRLVIGKFCSFGSDIQIFLCADHRIDWVTSYPLGLLKGVISKAGGNIGKGDILIGNDVWVGNNALIMSGVKIGNGAVIGAGSIITKDVLPYEVVAGNPARHIKFRFSEEKIQKLLEMKWWDWSIKEIISKSDFLSSPF